MDFKNKYLKYKNKYVNYKNVILKLQIGGGGGTTDNSNLNTIINNVKKIFIVFENQTNYINTLQQPGKKTGIILIQLIEAKKVQTDTRDEILKLLEQISPELIPELQTLLDLLKKDFTIENYNKFINKFDNSIA